MQKDSDIYILNEDQCNNFNMLTAFENYMNPQMNGVTKLQIYNITIQKLCEMFNEIIT